MIRGDHGAAQKCYMVNLKPGRHNLAYQLPHYVWSAENEKPSKLETDEVILDPRNPDKKVLLGTDIPDQIRPELVSFLKSKIANFAWSHKDMTGISSEVTVSTRFSQQASLA